ncbi:hypothetical protein SKAU_G00166130 [Synaphobranchus kaupii]|uniref:Uncharacterized protein n=1 Tax=Synaphobranchus kaupii TaxID=118154 RepID=A0A9Q1FJM6_SYNKA|nr:hypothetical protein SKAU_G00166130 [Synaphobranchus kaupii]
MFRLNCACRDSPTQILHQAPPTHSSKTRQDHHFLTRYSDTWYCRRKHFGVQFNPNNGRETRVHRHLRIEKRHSGGRGNFLKQTAFMRSLFSETVTGSARDKLPALPVTETHGYPSPASPSGIQMKSERTETASFRSLRGKKTRKTGAKSRDDREGEIHKSLRADRRRGHGMLLGQHSRRARRPTGTAVSGVACLLSLVSRSSAP